MHYLCSGRALAPKAWGGEQGDLVCSLPQELLGYFLEGKITAIEVPRTKPSNLKDSHKCGGLRTLICCHRLQGRHWQRKPQRHRSPPRSFQSSDLQGCTVHEYVRLLLIDLHSILSCLGEGAAGSEGARCPRIPCFVCWVSRLRLPQKNTADQEASASEAYFLSFSGGWKSEIEVLTGIVSGEVSFPGL